MDLFQRLFFIQYIKIRKTWEILILWGLNLKFV